MLRVRARSALLAGWNSRPRDSRRPAGVRSDPAQRLVRRQLLLRDARELDRLTARSSAELECLLRPRRLQRRRTHPALCRHHGLDRLHGRSPLPSRERLEPSGRPARPREHDHGPELCGVDLSGGGGDQAVSDDRLAHRHDRPDRARHRDGRSVRAVRVPHAAPLVHRRSDRREVQRRDDHHGDRQHARRRRHRARCEQSADHVRRCARDFQLAAAGHGRAAVHRQLHVRDAVRLDAVTARPVLELERGHGQLRVQRRRAHADLCRQRRVDELLARSACPARERLELPRRHCADA